MERWIWRNSNTIWGSDLDINSGPTTDGFTALGFRSSSLFLVLPRKTDPDPTCLQPAGLQVKKNVPRTRRGQEYFSNPITFSPFHCLFLCCRCGPRRVVEPGPQTCHLTASTVNCGGRLLDPPVIRFLRSTRVAQRLVTRGILSLEPGILRKGSFPRALLTYAGSLGA